MAGSGNESRSRRAPSRQRFEIAFGVRLVLTLVVTLAAIAAAQYLLTGPRLVERALAHEIQKYRSDASGLAEIHAKHHLDGWTADFLPVNVRELLEHMGHRSDVRLVRLVSPTGTVVGVGAADSLELTWTDAHGVEQALEGVTPGRRIDDIHRTLIDAAFESGQPSAGPAPSQELGDLAYHIPLELGGLPFVLEVITDDQLIRNEQHTLNRLVLTMLAVGMVLGIPVFYFVGGRGLGRRHATAVRHSSRDGLTGLGNHRAFQEEARLQFDLAARHDTSLSLALVDLDDFKAVNDSSGHRAGDEVLAEVGRILGSGRPEDRAFRIGGDEFALLLPFTDLRGARAVTERLREQVERANRGVTLSIGLAVADRRSASVEAVGERADAALYEAKRSGRNRVIAASDVEDDRAAPGSGKHACVRRILDTGRMRMAFQPIWDVDASSVLGFEALARPSAESGLDGPLEMFEAAARLGRLAEVDDLCRRAAFERIPDLPAGALLFVNVAPAALGHELTSAQRLAAMVADAGLDPARVVLELTERTVARQSVVAREAARLRAAGFKIALDDVGAGNAGLQLLRQIRVDYVKVDRSVVTAAALSDLGAQAVLIAVIAFANKTGADVIAEGIEQAEQLSFLRGLSEQDDPGLRQIRGVQGYLLGRPGDLETPVSIKGR